MGWLPIGTSALWSSSRRCAGSALGPSRNAKTPMRSAPGSRSALDTLNREPGGVPRLHTERRTMVHIMQLNAAAVTSAPAWHGTQRLMPDA
mmetsp:Transcript_87573/g.246011  ORF Transcript_87573/g.246011 Transcript_87573/m.246011 type:complete len:91 (-) Transcript_87573:227-499(-)